MNKNILFLLAMIIFTPSLSFSQYTNAVRIKIEGNGYADETIIRFINDATPYFDAYYDAYKMVSPNPSVPSIYSKLLLNENMSINSLPLYNKDTAIEIHTIIPIAGNYVVTLEEVYPVNNDYNIKLKELYSGSTIELNNTASMQLYFEPNNGGSLTFLFEISKLLTTSLSELNEASQSIISVNGNGIFELFFKNDTKNYIIIHDITGKEVSELVATNKQVRVDLSSQPRGIYFIKTEHNTFKVLR